MESPQSPHLSSLWVFALSAVESYILSPPVPISQLGTKLSSTVLLLFGLRVISPWEASEEFCALLQERLGWDAGLGAGGGCGGGGVQ